MLNIDLLGRKRSMMLVNVFFALGWLMLSQADAVWEVFFGMATLGMAIGLREAAVRFALLYTFPYSDLCVKV